LDSHSIRKQSLCETLEVDQNRARGRGQTEAVVTAESPKDDVQEWDVIVADEHQGWAVIRLVAIRDTTSDVGRLLFATVTELAQDRPVPAGMRNIDHFPLKGGKEKLHFRRTVLAKDEAMRWYRSLGEGEPRTPVPTRVQERKDYDGIPIHVSRLEDAQPWPKSGLPITDEFFTHSGKPSGDPLPFLGSVGGRVHRRFGEREGLESFLLDTRGQAWVARRMHVNLAEYQEYLGSAVYIAPDPVIRQIEHFRVPARDGLGERIVYRFVPRQGQSLDGVFITSFDKEARLLTNFETRSVPADGILDVDKGACDGQYGFVVTHERYGVLAYQPFTSFIRQMEVRMHAHSGRRRMVKVPLGDAEDSLTIEYEAAGGSELVSTSVFGEAGSSGANVRVEAEARARERRAEAKRYGQRWFRENSREEAFGFVLDLLRAARARVIIADPYLSSLQLWQFLYALQGSDVNTLLLTTKLAFNPKAPETKLDLLREFELGLQELEKKQSLKPDVRVLPASSLHDRFLVVDDEVWMVGNSLNSLGEKASMVVRLPNPDEVIARLQELVAKAPDLEAFIGSISAEGPKPAE
jgi:hypothetical protein